MRPEPMFLRIAKKYLNVKELPGDAHNVTILGWWKKLQIKVCRDETPWCAAFVGGVLEECGIQSTRSPSARSYVKWGAKLKEPAYGCVVTFWRGEPRGWSGHVGFVVGKDLRGNLMVLGGNQGDRVSIKPFAIDRVLSYSWPLKVPLDSANYGFNQLPVVSSDGVVSTNEA